jgi:GNAT superfamily N-acetyltransferase
MTRKELLQTRVTNPNTKRKVTVRYALTLPHDHPAYREAVRVVQRKRSMAAKSGTQKSVHTTSTSSRVGRPSLRTPDPTSARVVRKALRTYYDKYAEKELNVFGKKHMNGISPINILAQYLKTLGVTRVDQIEELYINPNESYDLPVLSISIQLTDGTELERTFTRRRNRNEWVVQHDRFFLGGAVERGQGLGKRMLRDTLDMADDMNIVAITLEAAADAGGYVWARMGGIPDPSERRHMYEHIDYKLDTLTDDALERMRARKEQLQADLDDPLYTKYKKELERKLRSVNGVLDTIDNNPELIRTITQLVKRELSKTTLTQKLSPDLLHYVANTPLGNYLLAGTSWKGYFNLRKGSMGRRMLEQSIGE